jgi:hypothetical protein
MVTANVFCRRLRVLRSGTAQSRPTGRRRLSTTPVVCLSAMPKETFMVRHIGIVASLYYGFLPRLPGGDGTRTMSGSNQIVREPRCFKPSLQAGPFLVW